VGLHEQFDGLADTLAEFAREFGLPLAAVEHGRQQRRRSGLPASGRPGSVVRTAYAEHRPAARARPPRTRDRRPIRRRRRSRVQRRRAATGGHLVSSARRSLPARSHCTPWLAVRRPRPIPTCLSLSRKTGRMAPCWPRQRWRGLTCLAGRRSGGSTRSRRRAAQPGAAARRKAADALKDEGDKADAVVSRQQRPAA
jgi:hypothetical protein